MNFKKINNEKGFGLWDLVFWVAMAAFGFWIYQQYLSHPDGLNARPATHSVYEDKK